MTDIVALITENPVVAFTDAKQYSEFYAKVKEQVDAHVPDVATAKGRAEIKALAFRVTRTKTALDDAGKKLNEDARKKIDAVDAQRRKIRAELDALAEEARRPLTEWETAEEDRQDHIRKVMEKIAALSRAYLEDGSDLIADRIRVVREIDIDPTVFSDSNEVAKAAQAKAVADLEMVLERARRHEADQAELARLRKEREEQDRAEAERLVQEKAEAERKRLAEEAEARAKREEDQRKAREEQIAEQARQAEMRKAQEAIDKAESETRALREKAEREERERAAAIQRDKDAQAAREADRKHRSALMGEAKQAIMTCGADEETAKKVVLAIIAGEVPHVTLRF